MNDIEIKKNVEKNIECNFIAFAISPWHANGIDATIISLQNLGVELNGYIYLCKHPITGTCVTKENFICDKKNIKFYDIELEPKNIFLKARGLILSLVKVLFLKKSNEKEIFILNPTYPDFNWINVFNDRKIIFINIDEGTGSFLLLKLSTWVKMHLKDNLNPFFKWVNVCSLYLVGILRQGIRTLLLKNIEKSNNFKYIDNNMFSIQKGKINKNDRVSKLYSKVFGKTDIDISNDEMEAFGNSIIVNTQPLMEDKLINSNQDLETLGMFFDTIERIGENSIILKPHPRESDIARYKKFNCTIYSKKNISQEVLIAHLLNKPKLIIGLFTSSLVTLSTLYDIPAISLAKIFINTNIDESTKRIVKSFIDLYEGIIMFPSTKEELEKMMRGVLKK